MNFQVGQIIEHQALGELGRGRVDQVTQDRLTVTFEACNGGERKTFVIPNEAITLTKDQSASGFEGPKVPKPRAKSRTTKAKAKVKTAHP